jgi:hypothetical protein
MKIIFLLSSSLFFCTLFLHAQEDNFKDKRHEIGIDITNTLTFLKKNYQSYLLNYRYFFKDKKYALRAGLNLDISNGVSDGKYPSAKLGIQKNKFDKKWNMYYGADFSYFYYKSNAVPTSTTRYGFTPMAGVQFYTKNRLSVSSEIGLNFHHFVLRSKNSFDPVDNTSYTQINIGYVGMFLVSYHF